TPVIVERFLRRVRPSLPGETAAQHLLGSGLADAACHRNDPGRARQAGTSRRPDTLERAQRIINPQEWSIARLSVIPGAGGRGGGASSESGWNDLVIMAGTGERDENLARFQRARVDRESGNGGLRRAIGPACRDRDEIVPGPQTRHAPISRSAAVISSWSEK